MKTMMISKMVRSFVALALALLVCLSFASCKKGDKDKTESTTSTEGTSSYNFVLDDDTDEPLTSEEEEAVASKWSSIVNDSDAIVIEPYKPSTSTDSSSSKVSSTGGSSSSDASSSESDESSKVSSAEPDESNNASSSEPDEMGDTSSSEPDESSNASTSSEIPYYPGVH